MGNFEKVRFECKLDHPNAKLPSRKRTTDAGWDVYSVIDVTINPNKTEAVAIGARISPPPGWYFTIEGRSSLFKEGIAPFRTIIDGTYTGLIFIILHNFSDKPFEIKTGDRIAQIVAHRLCNVEFDIVDEFSPEYDQRSIQGWGSSGR